MLHAAPNDLLEVKLLTRLDFTCRTQIVSTFLKSLDIPWPSIFGSIMARVNVVNLNLVQLPKTACLNPSPSFYAQFNGACLVCGHAYQPHGR